MRELAVEPDFSLAGLRVRPSQACIETGGGAHHVEPKVMDMLITLARAAGATLSRDQLIAACWGGRVVSDDAITRILGKVRQIAGMTDPPAFRIETLPKVGVRLVAGCDSAATDTGAAVGSTVVVLPFDNLGAGAELDFFSDGVAEEILGRLVRGSSLRVIGRTTSFQYRGPRKAEAAAELKATHVVDGALQRAGNRVRISVHLTETATGATLWTSRFDRDLTDIFALQDEIADQIARALDTVFSAPAQAPIPPAVYDLYLRTRALAGTPEVMRANIASLEAVVALAPDFADGWARLAAMRAWHALQLPYAERGPEIARAHAEIARCRALDPDNPETNYAAFWLAPAFGDYAAKAGCVRRMLAATPSASDAHALATGHYLFMGCGRLALHHARLAMALNPRDWAASLLHGTALFLVGDGEEAFAAIEAHLESWPDDNQAAAMLLMVCVQLERWDRFDALIEPRRLARYPLREHHVLIAVACAMRWPTPENKQLLLSGLAERIGRTGAADPNILYWSFQLGLGDEVMALMANARFGPGGGRGDMMGIIAYRTVTLFLRGFPAVRISESFPALCARLGLVDHWTTSGDWPDCADEVPYDFRAACAAARHIPCDPFMGAAQPAATSAQIASSPA